MIVTFDTYLFNEDVDISSAATAWKFGYSTFDVAIICASIMSAVFLFSWIVSLIISFLMLEKSKSEGVRRKFPWKGSLFSAIGVSLIMGVVLFPPGDSYGEKTITQRIWVEPAVYPFQVKNKENKETVLSLVSDKLKDSFDEKTEGYDFMGFDAECEKERRLNLDKISVFCGGKGYQRAYLDIGNSRFSPHIDIPQVDRDAFGFQRDLHDSPHRTTVKATMVIQDLTPVGEIYGITRKPGSCPCGN